MLDLSPTVRPTTWRERSRAIDRFRAGDFQDVDAVGKKLFPRSWSAHLRRDVAVLRALAAELAPHYDHEVERTLEGPDAAVSALAAIYGAVDIDAVMRRLARRLVTQHTVVGCWLPRRTSGGTMVWVVALWSPWEVEAWPHPLDPSVQALRRIRCRVATDASPDQVHYGVLDIDQEAGTAWWVRGGEQVGVYAPDGSIPMLRAPLFVARLEEPAPGDFFAPLPEHLYHMQLALSLSWSDIEAVARYQSHGQVVVYGQSQATVERLVWGPDTAVGIDAPPDEARIDVVAPQANLDGYIASTRAFEEAVRVAEGLRPTAFESHAVTAQAKLMELWDRELRRADVTVALRQAEQAVADAARHALGWNFGLGTGQPLGRVRVRVRYRMPEPPRDPAHEAQAAEALVRIGALHPADLIARRDGISRSEAMRRWEATIAALRDAGILGSEP